MFTCLSLLTGFRLARFCIVLRKLTIPIAVVDDGHIVETDIRDCRFGQVKCERLRAIGVLSQFIRRGRVVANRAESWALLVASSEVVTCHATALVVVGYSFEALHGSSEVVLAIHRDGFSHG